MSLLNAGLLTGLAFLAVPVIIHLLNRRRFKVIEWGAMRFLKAAITTQSRRLKLQDLLVLLVRMALLLCLVVGLCRPYLQSRTGVLGGKGASVDLVILLDRSFSMGLVENKASRFDAARDLARALVRGLKKGDSCTVLLVSDRAEPLLPGVRHDFAAIEKALDEARPGSGSTNLLAGIESGLKALLELKNPGKEIVVVSDFQRTSLPGGEDPAWEGVAKLLGDKQKFPRTPGLYAGRVGAGAADNVAILDLSVDPPVVGSNRPAAVRTRIANLGRSPAKSLRVKLEVDGESKGLRNIESLAPGQESIVSFLHHFTTPGMHALRAELLEDELREDNRRFAGVRALDAFPVRILAGPGSAEAFFSEADLLREGLDPRDSDQPDLRNVVRAEVTPLDEVRPGLFSDCRCVVVNNPPSVSDLLKTDLEGFVEQGGGLLITLGSATAPETLNARLWGEGKGLLPARILEPRGDPKDRKVFQRIVNKGFDHPALLRYNDPRNGDVGRARVFRWFGLEPPAAGGAARVLARLENGDPILIEKPFGRGRVMVLATSLDGAWNTLPFHPFYLPLLNDVVFHLGEAAQPPRNFLVGQRLTGEEAAPPAGESLAIENPLKGRQPVEVKPTTDDRRPTTAESPGKWQVAYGDTATPGLYRLVRVSPLPDKEPALADLFAVNVNPRESDLSPLGDLREKEATARLQMTFHADSRSLLAAIELGRSGREFAMWFLWSALFLLTLEPALTRAFSIRKPSPAP